MAVRGARAAANAGGRVFERQVAASDANLVAAFRQALNESGYVEGQNVAIEFRWADGRLDRLPTFVADLVDSKVAVLFAGAADVAIGALKAAATTLPVVFATGSDPVGLGLVTSLNRPDGKISIIGVEEADVFAFGLAQSCIAGFCGPTIRDLLNDSKVFRRLLQLFSDRERVVRGSIVYDYDFCAVHALFEDG